MPDGTSRFSYKGKPVLHYMGCSTFANFTVLPEIALAKVREDAPFEKICYIGCGVTTGVGAVAVHRQGGARRPRGGVRARRHRPQRGAGRAHRRGRPDRRRRPQPGPARNWRDKFGLTDFVNPKDVSGDMVAHLVELTKGGADHSFECVGNPTLMRQALECAHKGWGKSTIIGVAGAGQEISTRPFQLVTGRVWQGSAFGGARGRTDVPRIVDWYMEGKINIDDLITHILPLERINDGVRPDDAGRVDPQRGGVLIGGRPLSRWIGRPHSGVRPGGRAACRPHSAISPACSGDAPQGIPARAAARSWCTASGLRIR